MSYYGNFVERMCGSCNEVSQGMYKCHDRITEQHTQLVKYNYQLVEMNKKMDILNKSVDQKIHYDRFEEEMNTFYNEFKSLKKEIVELKKEKNRVWSMFNSQLFVAFCMIMYINYPLYKDIL